MHRILGVMQKKYKIVFIGAGNVATHLATTLHNQHHTITQIYSRTENAAKALAKQVDAEFTIDIQEIFPNADAYFFTLKDDVLAEFLPKLSFLNGLWLHTAGSLPMDIFSSYTKNYGVFYPLQTFSKTREIDFSIIPVFIEASNEDALCLLNDLAKNISDKVVLIDSEKRKYLHLAAVFTCNFVNRLYDIGAEILQETGLPFDVLLPLIDETASKVHELSPMNAQTGPAVRFDEKVMSGQLALLNNESFKTLYKQMSNDIYIRHQHKQI